MFPWKPAADALSGYEIGELESQYEGKSLWALHKAKKKSTNEPVSVFRCDIAGFGNKAERAKQSLKRLKTLLHPAIIKYIDSYESDKVVLVVTEPVTPLSIYIESEPFSTFTQSQKDFFIAYGLLTTAYCLNFLNNDCQLNHNNINIYSIFVNNAGIFKIGSLEYVCSVDELPPPKCDSLCEKYTPPERSSENTSNAKPGHKYSVDSWGLGCLVWELFNKPLTSSSSVRTVGKMPRPLAPHYNKLVQTNPRQRTSPKSFIDDCKIAKVFFDKPALEAVLFVEGIQLIKDPGLMAKNFNLLEKELKSIPKDTCKFKILPDLINAFEYGGADSNVLDLVFKIGQHYLSGESYQNVLIPHIIKFYTSKDRATRSKLLHYLDSYIKWMSDSVINNDIFPQIVQGFLDNNYTIRELTLKSILDLVPKLNTTNLNHELLNHLVRLITRDQDSQIRMKAVSCLGDIAKLLNAQSQQNVFLLYTLKAMSDPFPGTRLAAITAIQNNKELYTEKDIATKVMPAMCIMCVDQDSNVKQLSLRFMKDLINLLEETDVGEVQQGLSKNLNQADQVNKNKPSKDKRSDSHFTSLKQDTDLDNDDFY